MWKPLFWVVWSHFTILNITICIKNHTIASYCWSHNESKCTQHKLWSFQFGIKIDEKLSAFRAKMAIMCIIFYFPSFTFNRHLLKPSSSSLFSSAAAQWAHSDWVIFFLSLFHVLYQFEFRLCFWFGIVHSCGRISNEWTCLSTKMMKNFDEQRNEKQPTSNFTRGAVFLWNAITWHKKAVKLWKVARKMYK